MSRETYVIHVTKKCNMDCAYCYEKDKTSEYTWEEIKSFIDKLVKHRTSDNFMVEFLGGEPMLAWDKIVLSYEYLESIEGLDIDTYAITCNGTIMTDEIFEYIKNNPKLYWAASLDGHMHSNQLRVFSESRINSYKTVMNNIKRFQDENINFGVHMVVHPYNVAMLSDSIIHFYKLGIRGVDPGIVESTLEIDKEFAQRYVDEMDIISKLIVSGTLEGLDVSLFSYLKPDTDVRTYIKDDEGKTIGESYGRSGDDITNQDVGYRMWKSHGITETQSLIYKIRSSCYHNHQERLNG